MAIIRAMDDLKWDSVDFQTLKDCITGSTIRTVSPVYDGERICSILIVLADACGSCAVFEIGAEYLPELNGETENFCPIVRIALLNDDDRLPFEHDAASIPDDARRSIEKTVNKWLS